MKFIKVVTINLGDYNSLKLGVDDAPSHEEADKFIISECKREGIEVNHKIRQALSWAEK